MITLAYAQSSAQGELGIAQFLTIDFNVCCTLFFDDKASNKKSKRTQRNGSKII